MALPATEAFTGTGALSASWTSHLNSCTRSSDQGKGVTAVDFNSAFWNADTFNNDQYSQFIIRTLATAEDDYFGPMVRASGSGGSATGYGAFWTNGLAADVQECTAGSWTTIAAAHGAAAVANDVVRLEAEGTTLRLKINGTQTGTDITGESSIASGSAGIVFFENDSLIDDWEGGNLGGGGGGGTILPMVNAAYYN